MNQVRRDVFQAISDPTRREIIGLLSQRTLNINNVADHFTISRPAVAKHIRILTECGLVVVQTEWLAEAQRARIVVADDGPGIPPEDRERLFVPYFSTKATGMGLGLPIVHQIISDHGGSIRVEDNTPHGSRFVVEVPVGRPVAAPVQA